MVVDARGHFRESADAYSALLSRPGQDYDQVTRELRADDGLPQVFFNLYASTCERPTFVQVFEHPPFTFVFDCPSSSGQPGDDRTVAALGVSQRRESLSELLRRVESGLRDGVNSPASTTRLGQAITDFANRLPARRHREFRSAVAASLDINDAAAGRREVWRELDEALEHPDEELIMRLRAHVLPVLQDECPPRSSAARRQYRGMTGMKDMDIGHFIAHAVGGPPDINTFPQNRALNRGWSDQGKAYRRMERFVASHPGFLHFMRAVYDDDSWTPRYLEFGVLVPRALTCSAALLAGEPGAIGQPSVVGGGVEFQWWLGVFDNRDDGPKRDEGPGRERVCDDPT